MSSNKTEKKICYVTDLTEEERFQINNLCNSSFRDNKKLPSKIISRNYLDSLSPYNLIISLLYFGGSIIGVCFAKIEQKRVIKPLSPEYLYLHSITIDENHRGMGYCYHLVRNLIKGKIKIDGTMRQLGKLPMYLNVCVNIDNPNEAAIKCYKKNGFKFVDMIYIMKDDGPNGTMVRPKGIGKGRKTKKLKKK